MKLYQCHAIILKWQKLNNIRLINNAKTFVTPKSAETRRAHLETKLSHDSLQQPL